MTTTPKGYTELTNASDMSGPEQINDAERFVEDLIGESVATASALPASGNWVGRLVTTVDTGSLYQCTALPGTWSVVREDTGWTTPGLLNSWTAFGSGFVGPRYKRLNGQTILQGTVKGGALSPILQLPAGFRPSTTMTFVTIANAGIVEVRIDSSGNVTPIAYYAGGGNGIVGLNLPAFPAEQ